MLNEILIVVAIVALFWVFRALFPARHKPHLESLAHPPPQAANGSPYQAVSIHAYGGACEAAKSLVGTRFLTADAPLIPLEGCTAEKCHCIYRHHEDRRSGESDRRKKHEAADELVTSAEFEDRRNARGRRAKDLLAA